MRMIESGGKAVCLVGAWVGASHAAISLPPLLRHLPLPSSLPPEKKLRKLARLGPRPSLSLCLRCRPARCCLTVRSWWTRAGRGGNGTRWHGGRRVVAGGEASDGSVKGEGHHSIIRYQRPTRGVLSGALAPYRALPHWAAGVCLSGLPLRCETCRGWAHQGGPRLYTSLLLLPPPSSFFSPRI